MLIETLSVREAREQLPSVLARFRNGDRTPVGVGSHRKTEAVMVPVEVFDELTAELAQAVAALRAEGFTVGTDAKAVTARWARGEIGADARVGSAALRRWVTVDPYVDASGVLRHRLGISDPQHLEEVEAGLTRSVMRLKQPRSSTPPTARGSGTGSPCSRMISR
ncbi:MAG: hypothetical protein ACRDTG_10565 [Pseudonocardiaceae bacterium]